MTTRVCLKLRCTDLILLDLVGKNQLGCYCLSHTRHLWWVCSSGKTKHQHWACETVRFIHFHKTQVTNKITQKIHVLKVCHRTERPVALTTAHTDAPHLVSTLVLSGTWPPAVHIGLCSVLRPRQHSIGYMGDGFYRSKDPTNSIKVLKEKAVKEKNPKNRKKTKITHMHTQNSRQAVQIWLISIWVELEQEWNGLWHSMSNN